MFFCEDCKLKYNWPGIIPMSYGPCEMCRITAPCYDVPSSALPDPRRDDDED